MKIAKDITGLTGGTPLVWLNRITEGTGARIAAKLEYFNPMSSVKDRIGVSMINAAEECGLLKNGCEIVEPTSGNTGIGLAFAAAARGYSIKIFMPETFSIERRKIMKALGADLALTPADKGMPGAIEAAENYCRENKNTFMPMQFKNPANVDIHYKTTGPEIWRDTDGEVDIFVAGVGTGGTITGVGKFLAKKKASVKIYAVEPAKSPVLSGGEKGPHKIQGIGAGFIPEILDTSIYNDIIRVEDDDALIMIKRLAREEGLFVGLSSAAAAHAALYIASKEENKGRLVVTLFPDSGDRYLSNDWFD